MLIARGSPPVSSGRWFCRPASRFRYRSNGFWLGPCGSHRETLYGEKVTQRRNSDKLAITLGVEEEFFLIDPETADLLREPDEGIYEACHERTGRHKFVREFLRSQIETNTCVCTSIEDVRSAICETRRILVRTAEEHGASVLATSTHPFAAWETQVVTPGQRYRDFAITFQESLRRFLVGGMHIHAGFGNRDSRVRIMTALRRYLPLLHALSGSSPFNEGRLTGFKSYRLNLVGSLPRTGLPNALASWAEFDDLVNDYLRMRFIQTAVSCGGTSGRHAPFPRWNCVSATSARASKTQCASLPFSHRSSGTCFDGTRKVLCQRTRPSRSSPRTAGWHRGTA